LSRPAALQGIALRRRAVSLARGAASAERQSARRPLGATARMAYLCEAVAWAGLGARHDADATAMRERVSCRSRNSCARRRPPRRSRRVPGLVEPLRYARSGALV